MNEVVMKLTKSTTNYHKFDTTPPLLGSIYIPKEWMPTPPAQIRVLIQEEVTA